MFESLQDGISLEDLRKLTEALLKSGASIVEINKVRIPFSRIKGGKLLGAAGTRDSLTLVLSDVVGDRLDVIASGPTVADPSTFADACGVLTRFGLWEKVPPSVAARLRSGLAGKVEETPKPGDGALRHVWNHLVGTNAMAVQAAAERAAREGLEVRVLEEPLAGEARDVGRRLGRLASELAATRLREGRPLCVLCGGETTVTVRGSGQGGRNLEAALAAALQIEGVDNALLAFLATDGSDGTTEAAGGLVGGASLEAARGLGIDVEACLENNDSYGAVRAMGGLLVTGPTLTNVNDVALILVW